MSFALLLIALSTAADPPAACRPPLPRDVAPLANLVKRSTALATGLETVVARCFDASGAWTGGAAPDADCASAREACRLSADALEPELMTLLLAALGDFEQPFLGARYAPRRQGLAERPAVAVDCMGRQRGVLADQALAQLDWARLAAQTLSEYATYRAWLSEASHRCARAAADEGPASPARPPGTDERPVTRGVEGLGLDVERTAAPFPRRAAADVTREELWQGLAAERARLEQDADWATGFLDARELRACRCTPPNPTALWQRARAQPRTTEADGDDERAERCERCVQEAFGPWKSRATKQCALMARLSDFELGVLERSEDGPGLPPRCFAAARAQRRVPDAGLATPSPHRAALRVVTGAECLVSVSPGDALLRNGERWPVPADLQLLEVRSTCDGLVEVYWGDEARPRVAEHLAAEQPLELRFAR